jgi:hypothetical protein
MSDYGAMVRLAAAWRQKGDTMRVIWTLVGLVAIAAGVVWTLQGLDVLGGSAMSGETTWAIVGPIVAVVGMLVFLFGIRRRDNSDEDQI